MHKNVVLHPEDSVERPVKCGLALTAGYLVLTAGAFVAIDWTLGFLGQEHTTWLLGHNDLATAVMYTVVSSLNFLALCYWLLHRLMSHTKALERVDAARVMAEHRALLGALAPSAIHDSNNILMGVQGYAHLLEHHTNSLAPQGREYLHKLQLGLTRLSELVALFKRYATARNAMTPLVLDTVLTECLELIRRHDRLAGCRLTFVRQKSVAIHGNPMLIWSALGNLVLNASEATGGQGDIQVRLLVSDREATVEIHDNGPGVAPGDEARIFQAFYTTKPDGTGLGLPSVQRCAQAHGGRVQVKRSPLGGACFQLSFPILQAKPPPNATSSIEIG